MIGFEFMKNFDAPYQADSITDFWRRWHISLSTFLARLSVHSARWQPAGAAPDVPEPDRRHAPGRPVARGELDVRGLGCVSRGAAGLRALPGQAEPVSSACRGSSAWESPLSSCCSPGCCSARPPSPTRRVTSAPCSASEAARPTPRCSCSPAQLYTREALVIVMACVAFTAWPSQAYEWSETISWPKALVVHPLFVVALLAMFAQSFNPFLYFQF